MLLSAKHVLVTGGGSGIGRALAQKFAGQGALVSLTGRRETALLETGALLPSGTFVGAFPADLTKAEDRQGLAAALKDLNLPLDLLVNNAGMVSVGAFTEISDDELEALFLTNLVAPIALTRTLLPLMADSDAPCIVNVGSMFGEIAHPLFAAYSATKFGLRGFSDALRRELAAKNVSVIYASPRATRTPAADQFSDLEQAFDMTFDTPEQAAARIVAGILQGESVIRPTFAERFFSVVQSLAPALVDKALVKKLAQVSRGI